MQHLLLLHGALGAREQLLPLGERLANEFYIHRINFAGHGGEPMPDGPWSIASFAQQILTYIDTYIPAGEQVSCFGYSMGGYVGMYINRHYPGKLQKTITLATKYHWDEAGAAREVKMLDPETMLMKVPAFAAQLEQRHAPHNWKELLQKTSTLLLDMGRDNPLKPADYPLIAAPCLLLLGDRDKMVSLEETVQAYKQLPSAQMGVLPGTAHALEQVDTGQLSSLVRKFIHS